MFPACPPGADEVVEPTPLLLTITIAGEEGSGVQPTLYRLLNDAEQATHGVDARGQPARAVAASSAMETGSEASSDSGEEVFQVRTRYGLGGGASGTGHPFGLEEDTTNLRTVFRPRIGR